MGDPKRHKTVLSAARIQGFKMALMNILTSAEELVFPGVPDHARARHGRHADRAGHVPAEADHLVVVGLVAEPPARKRVLVDDHPPVARIERLRRRPLEQRYAGRTCQTKQGSRLAGGLHQRQRHGTRARGRGDDLGRVLVDDQRLAPGGAVGADLDVEVIVAAGADLGAAGEAGLQQQACGIGGRVLVDLGATANRRARSFTSTNASMGRFG